MSKIQSVYKGRDAQSHQEAKASEVETRGKTRDVNVVVIMGLSSSKDVDSCLKHVKSIADTLYFVRADSDR
eukprot:116101-Amorphochlora_amoeboformis.AAC.1